MIFPSQARKESMALAFAELDKVANPVICEVGRLRNPNAGESDGHSTLSFLDYVNTYDGRMYSIDGHPVTADVCWKLFTEKGMDDSRLKYINNTAISEFAEQRPWFVGNSVGKYDLLYLDGWDLDDPHSAEEHLLCFMLARPLIKPGGLVLIDDTGTSDLGKGKLVVPVAKLMGWEVVHQGFQTLLRKTL